MLRQINIYVLTRTHHRVCFQRTQIPAPFRAPKRTLYTFCSELICCIGSNQLHKAASRARWQRCIAGGRRYNVRVLWSVTAPTNRAHVALVSFLFKLLARKPGRSTDKSKYTELSQIKHQIDATLCRFYFCRVTLHVSGVKRPSSGVLKNWHGGHWYVCYGCR